MNRLILSIAFLFLWVMPVFAQETPDTTLARLYLEEMDSLKKRATRSQIKNAGRKDQCFADLLEFIYPDRPINRGVASSNEVTPPSNSTKF